MLNRPRPRSASGLTSVGKLSGMSGELISGPEDLNPNSQRTLIQADVTAGEMPSMNRKRALPDPSVAVQTKTLPQLPPSTARQMKATIPDMVARSPRAAVIVGESGQDVESWLSAVVIAPSSPIEGQVRSTLEDLSQDIGNPIPFVLPKNGDCPEEKTESILSHEAANLTHISKKSEDTTARPRRAKLPVAPHKADKGIADAKSSRALPPPPSGKGGSDIHMPKKSLPPPPTPKGNRSESQTRGKTLPSPSPKAPRRQMKEEGVKPLEKRNCSAQPTIAKTTSSQKAKETDNCPYSKPTQEKILSSHQSFSAATSSCNKNVQKGLSTPARRKCPPEPKAVVTPGVLKMRKMPTPTRSSARTPTRSLAHTPARTGIQTPKRLANTPSRKNLYSDTPKRLPKPAPPKPAITSITDLTQEAWQCIVKYLATRDLAAISRQCKRLRGTMHKMTGFNRDTPITLEPNKIPLERVATVTSAWPNLDFAYVCQHSASGTFWSAQSEKFENVSMVPRLGRLHTLTLSECDDIDDVSGLTDLRVLKINRCNSLRDLGPLAAVPCLSLEWCLNIADVGVLSNVRELTIDRCPKVSSLVGFEGGCVEKLIIRKCRNVRDLQGLMNVPLKELRLEQMHNITDLSPLNSVEKLVVRECPRVKDVSPVLNTPVLELIQCRNLIDIENLVNLANVKLIQGGPQSLRRMSRGSNAEIDLDTTIEDDGDTSVFLDSVSVAASSAPTPIKKAIRLDKEAAAGDWVEAAKSLRDDQDREDMLKQQRDEQRRTEIEEALAEKRLEEAQRRIDEENARFLAEAEERAAFDAEHRRAREERQKASEQRKEQMIQAEENARKASEAAAASLISDLQRKRAEAERVRDKRKDRIASMLARARKSGTS